MKKFLLLALLSASTLFASNIEVKDAYARATPPGLPNSAAFMTIENKTDKNIALTKATSNVSKVAELSMTDGVMKMYQVPKIDIPANGETALKPGGFHVMLIGLHKPLKEKEKVTITLYFSNGENKTITIPVKTVMDGMMEKGSCGSGKCGSAKKSTKKKAMSCGTGKCGSN
jgi:periplasmic copper chaperone A